MPRGNGQDFTIRLVYRKKKEVWNGVVKWTLKTERVKLRKQNQTEKPLKGTEKVLLPDNDG